MLDELLKRDDVLKFIENLKTSERYYEKDNTVYNKRPFYISHELALYTFYDALFKYKLILDDVYLFDEYLDQLEKLYKKLDNFDDIVLGINKLICKMCIIKLDIKNINNKEEKNKLISYIYKYYVEEGYYFHGFNTSYVDSIEKGGFVPEVYQNYYDKFIRVNNIFAKYNVINIINKDFQNKEVYFTDDLIMGCYYSNYAPMFFYQFLTNEDYFGKLKRKDSYLIDDINPLISHLKRFMSNNLFNESDRDYILDLVKEEWELLHRVPKKISLIAIPRRMFGNNNLLLEDFLDDEESEIYDIIDRILSPKQNSIPCRETLEEVDFIQLDGYYEKDEKSYTIEITPEEEFYKYKEEEVSREFLDVYGKSSIFLILGSLFITLGVIITIFMAIRGL